MKMREIKQFSLVMGLLLSLFASSFSACICSHHNKVKAAETESHSCHSQTAEATHDVTESGGTAPAESVNTLISEGDCCCVQQSAPEVVVKSETIKPEKQISALTPELSATVLSIGRIISTHDNFQPKPLYLNDSFYNLTPGRAPPRL